MDAHQRRVVRVGMGKQQVDLLLLDVFFQRLQVGTQRAVELALVLIDGQFQ
jgi:hypothetical protein